MDNKKKLIIAISASILILGIIILLIVKLILINKNKSNEDTINNIEIENNIVEEENIVENTIEQNSIENQVESSENQTAQNEVIVQTTPIADPEQEVDKDTIQKQESNQEKAINIAKKDWGEDNLVYFSFEGVNNGKYTVAVREVNTTHAVRYYYINVVSGNFDIEE